jgi:cysteinyl-tRNA synthetase
VDDVAQTWRGDLEARQQLRKEKHAYNRSERDPTTLSAAAVAEVEGLLAQRSAARAKMNFAEADKCRDALKVQFGVYLDDKRKEWTADPRAAVNGERAPGRRDDDRPLVVGGADYKRAADDTVAMSAERVAAVVALLDQRCDARARRDFNRADEIKEQLLVRARRCFAMAFDVIHASEL